MRAGLLKRLNGEDALQGDVQSLAAFIALHIRDLLNVRAGSCPSRGDLGLPAISPVQLQGDAVQSLRLAQVIQLQVVRFEPRLLDPRVTPESESSGVLWRLLLSRAMTAGRLFTKFVSIATAGRVFCVEVCSLMARLVEHLNKVSMRRLATTRFKFKEPVSGNIAMFAGLKKKSTYGKN